jgi:6-pyruvoyl-tetrahydropterin synthase
VNQITLRHQRRFVADHFHDLPGFQEDRHGHNWELEAEVSDGPGVSGRLDEVLDAWVAGVDYQLLNALKSLEGRNPTAEALAEWAFRSLESQGLEPVGVKVREKANYWAACRRARV